METRSRLRRKTTTGAPAATDLRPWELCWSTDGKLYIGVGDTDGHATSVQQISGAGVSWLGSMAYINDAPSDSTGYVRKDGAWAAESGTLPQPNLIANSNAQNGTDGWSGGSATLTVDDHAGRQCFKAVNASSAVSAYHEFPVAAGEDYSFGIDLAASSATGLKLQVNFYTAGYSYLASAVGTTVTSDGDFHRSTASRAAPATAAIARIYAQAVGSGVALYFGRVKVERSDTATPYTEEAATQTLAEKVASVDVTNIVVTSTTPTSDAANSGKLFLVY